ncbi:hypothetical protein [Streptomyces sp. NPDC048242]|uniref:hypothetical protein n=1 Tax=Streptomyces sp. NPDC048242 TaxID=3155026 RepID=UPI0033CDFAAC
MPSNDVRILVQAAVPTAVVGAIATVVSGVVAGGKGAFGAVVATLLVSALMGLGLFVLQRTAKSLPQLFQMMGLLLYAAQLLLVIMFIAVFKDTTAFNPRAFAIGIVVCTLTWTAAQTRAHMKAKTLYVEPDASSKGDKPEKTGHSS